MTVLGEFCSPSEDRYVIRRIDGEVMVDGDQFELGPQRLARLDHSFLPEDKAAIDEIVPLVWDFWSIQLEMMVRSFVRTRYEYREHIPARRYFFMNLMSFGVFPELTHSLGYWYVWDAAEQEEYLRRYSDQVTMAQYALMRGFKTPEEGAGFLHTYAERSGCLFKTHVPHPEKCWFGRYSRTMAEWLSECADWSARMEEKAEGFFELTEVR